MEHQKKFICKFFVYGKPIPKGSHKAFVRGKRAFITDSQGDNLLTWEEAIRQKAIKFFPTLITDKAIFLELVFMFQRPKNHFTQKGKKTSKFRTLHIVKPDADKLTRAVGDALTGIVYRDDSQLQFLSIKKVYNSQQGVEITIYKEDDGDKNEQP